MSTVQSFSVVAAAVEQVLASLDATSELSVPDFVKQVTDIIGETDLKDVKSAVDFAIHNHPTYGCSRGLKGGIKLLTVIAAQKAAKAEKDAARLARTAAKATIEAKVAAKVTTDATATQTTSDEPTEDLAPEEVTSDEEVAA